MTLESQMQQLLRRLSTTGLNGPAQTVRVSTDSLECECTLASLDAIGCELAQITVTGSVIADASMSHIRAIAKSLARDMTYLLEPIRTIESDADLRTAQLRSDPPHQTDDATFYYEIVARPAELSLCRYAKSSGEPRRRVNSAFTHEVLVRIVRDFERAVAK